MVEEVVLTRTETANRGMYTLAARGSQEIAIPELMKFNTGRVVSQTRLLPERVSHIGIMGGGPLGKADLVRYYLAGYDRVLNESPQVRNITRIIGRNPDADVMGATPGVVFNNQALDLMASGSSDYLIQSKYMQQPNTRSEGVGWPWHVFETPPDALRKQSVADDSVEAPIRHPIWPASFNAHHQLDLMDTGPVQENQRIGLNFWSSTGRGITEISGPGLNPEWFEKVLGLASALSDLKESLKFAREEGGIIPPPRTVVRARTIIGGLYSKAPRVYSVYLMPNGAIAIDTRGRKPDGALLTVTTDGTVCCSGEKDGRKWHRDYGDQDPLADPTLVVELCELGLPKK